MAYTINARLESGAPSLTIIDAITGEERLHWRGDSGIDGSYDWPRLFKRLVMLSCAEKISLHQRAATSVFGDECIKCVSCVDQNERR